MGDIISTSGLSKRFGGLTAVDGVDYSVPEGQAAGIIGPNGSGKTTFFNLLSGYFPPSAGRISLCGQDVTALSAQARVTLGMARTFQLVSVFASLSVWENLVLPVIRFREGETRPTRFFLRSTGRRALLADCEEALDAVGLTALAQAPTAELSYGDRRMLEIAMALALKPRLLLLDEPLAGLSDHEIAQVVALIDRMKHQFSLIIIEHKISKIVGLVHSLSVMNEGRSICFGPPEKVLADPEVRACYWGKSEPC